MAAIPWAHLELLNTPHFDIWAALCIQQLSDLLLLLIIRRDHTDFGQRYGGATLLQLYNVAVYFERLRIIPALRHHD